MIDFRSRRGGRDSLKLAALHKSFAIIEFDTKGGILAANKNFCALMGYDEKEIVGKHHRIFVDKTYADSAEYRDFWAQLGRGVFDSREYKRITKSGAEVWIRASYNPILDAKGRCLGVMKVASDVTAEKLKGAEFESKMAALSRVQAVIEFSPNGEVLSANQNFLGLMGYTLEEIRGKHHRMFVEPAFAASTDYAEFWRRLNAGELVSNSFKRIGKGGKEVWIQASYNPMFDAKGEVYKVVKFANDITDLTRLGAGLEALAANHVDKEIPVEFSPAYDRLRRDFNSAVRGLGDSLMEVKSCAQLVSNGADEIAAASDELSRRTEQQAANLEETAAALGQVTETVRKTAGNADETHKVVVQARQDAENGGVIVREAVAAMQRIEKSSQEIEQIISVIDEIAFQTNLLALNAGVEAARAGEAGRGFAVVASEVRALALRSAEAAKAIKSLIATSKTQVEKGVDLVGETGKSLGFIVGRVAEISDLIAAMNSGAHEQSESLVEVNRAISQLDEATQRNAAMAQEATAAARSMRQEAEKLADVVGRFSVRETAGDEMTSSARRTLPALQRGGRNESAARDAA
ncbi:MAG TPA: PAS domain-containing methyl-accepting chemotaxis protein [Roseiarcus sp.]|jgi:methyl-accepting chemotaxis protein